MELKSFRVGEKKRLRVSEQLKSSSSSRFIFHKSNQGLSVKFFVFGLEQSSLCVRRVIALVFRRSFQPFLLLLSAESSSRGGAAERSSVEIVMSCGLPLHPPSTGPRWRYALGACSTSQPGPGNVDYGPEATFHSYYQAFTAVNKGVSFCSRPRVATDCDAPPQLKEMWRATLGGRGLACCWCFMCVL